MHVYDIRIGVGRRLLAEDSHVTVFSVDGEHAHLIVETHPGGLSVFTCDDAEFVEKARAYGFSAPRIVQPRR